MRIPPRPIQGKGDASGPLPWTGQRPDVFLGLREDQAPRRGKQGSFAICPGDVCPMKSCPHPEGVEL